MLSSLEKGWRLVPRRVDLVLGGGAGAERTAVSGTHCKYLSWARTSWSLHHEPGTVHQSQGMEVIKFLDGTL